MRERILIVKGLFQTDEVWKDFKEEFFAEDFILKFISLDKDIKKTIEHINSFAKDNTILVTHGISGILLDKVSNKFKLKIALAYNKKFFLDTLGNPNLRISTINSFLLRFGWKDISTDIKKIVVSKDTSISKMASSISTYSGKEINETLESYANLIIKEKPPANFVLIGGMFTQDSEYYDFILRGVGYYMFLDSPSLVASRIVSIIFSRR